MFSGGQERDSAILTQPSPQTPLPPRRAHNTNQNSLCCSVGPPGYLKRAYTRCGILTFDHRDKHVLIIPSVPCWYSACWLPPGRGYGKNVCVCAESLSRGWLFLTPWTVASQAPLSVGFPRQEYWSGLPFPTPGGLPDSGIKPVSPGLAGGVCNYQATWEARWREWAWGKLDNNLEVCAMRKTSTEKRNCHLSNFEEYYPFLVTHKQY